MTSTLRTLTATSCLGLAIGLLAPAAAQQQQPEQVEPTADVPMAVGWRKTTVVEELEHPWGMAFLPNGDLLITERPGRLRIVPSSR